MDKYKYLYIDEKGIYCYKDSDVLINKLNTHDSDELYEAEQAFSSARQAQLNKKPIKGNFDFAHLKAIHEYLFQDIYYWAGKVRTVAIAKGNMFCLPQFIESYANEIFAKLRKDNFYKGYSKEGFIDAITELLSDINALHPFREGNGRTQREFIRCLGLINGYDFDWSLVTKDENVIASYESVNGDKLQKIIVELK